MERWIPWVGLNSTEWISPNLDRLSFLGSWLSQGGSYSVVPYSFVTLSRIVNKNRASSSSTHQDIDQEFRANYKTEKTPCSGSGAQERQIMVVAEITSRTWASARRCGADVSIWLTSGSAAGWNGRPAKLLHFWTCSSLEQHRRDAYVYAWQCTNMIITVAMPLVSVITAI